MTHAIRQLGWSVFLSGALIACGGASARSTYATARRLEATEASGSTYGGVAVMESATAPNVDEVALSSREVRFMGERNAQNATAAPRTTSPNANNPNTTNPNAAQRLLVYTAAIDIVVNNINESIGLAVTLANNAGGFMASRNDTEVVLRVPSPRFDDVAKGIEHLGDVSHRTVDVQDVSEQYHDLEIQLASSRAVRARLEEMLRRATVMADALAIERELQRVGAEIDQIEGKLRFFMDRVSLSTITVHFFPRPTSGSMQPTTYGTPELVIPFGWISSLGLPQLLESR